MVDPQWYMTAVQSLGVRSLIQRQWSKRVSKVSTYSLTSKRLNRPVLVRRNTSDLAVFDQIFVEREYRCLDHLNDVNIVLDCGANAGYSSAYFLSRFPKCRVVAVEPDPDNFAVLEKNLAPYGQRAIAVRAAVWSRNEPLQFNRHFAGTGNEWARSVERGLGLSETEITALDMPSLIALSKQSRISVLKIDIEGAELELFAHGRPDWLDQVDNIVIELHGDECREAFHSAIARDPFKISACGELTVCERM